MLRHSGASADISFAWTLYDRIIDLSDVFANHFNNLLALDFQEEAAQRPVHKHIKGNGGRLSGAAARMGGPTIKPVQTRSIGPTITLGEV